MSTNPYQPYVRRDSISWWAGIRDTRNPRRYLPENVCFTAWGAERSAKRAARKVWALEQRGLLDYSRDLPS